jgi:sialate O-acetylesterase
MKLKVFMLSLLVITVAAKAAVKPGSLFSNDAILQRGVAVPVWGTAGEGEKVSVEFAGQKVETVASNGKWMVKLKPLKAGGPYTMVIKGENVITLTNILVGEVWVCSGQSNMERQLGPRGGQKPIIGWEKAKDEANYPEIRQYHVRQNPSAVPVEDANSKWVICTPETAKDFTAVGFFFARDLHQKLKVPVGLLFSAVGGTPAENWTSAEALAATPELKRVVTSYEQAINQYPASLVKYQQEETALLAKYSADSAQAKQENKPLPRKPTAPRDPKKSGSAGGLYNGMIRPLQPFAIKGVIWYQGEANNSSAKVYQTLFPVMITDWRKAWAQGEFPFLFVQIAPFKGMGPEIREAQLFTSQRTPNTAMAVTTDCGDSADIHPSNKQPVGERLALAAKVLAYGEKIEYAGPVYNSLTVKDNQAILTFTHAKTLVAKEGDLKGFVIAGEDKVFVPATAVIKGKTIVVTAPGIIKPVAVRYAWSNVPDVNLYNEAGLPASPFRTDIAQ